MNAHVDLTCTCAIQIDFIDVGIDDKLLTLIGTYVAPETSTNSYVTKERETFQNALPPMISAIEFGNRCCTVGGAHARTGGSEDLKQADEDLRSSRVETDKD